MTLNLRNERRPSLTLQ